LSITRGALLEALAAADVTSPHAAEMWLSGELAAFGYANALRSLTVEYGK
jgi:hypothetical protein